MQITDKDPCPVGRNVALGIKGLAEREKLKSAMQGKVFIDFLRKVAEIELFTYYTNEHGQLIGESKDPPSVHAIVDAAKDALKKIEEAKAAIKEDEK